MFFFFGKVRIDFKNYNFWLCKNHIWWSKYLIVMLSKSFKKYNSKRDTLYHRVVSKLEDLNFKG